MIPWYLAVKKILRSIEEKAKDALELFRNGGKEATLTVNRYIRNDYESLLELWQRQYPDEHLGNLGRHIHFGDECDYSDMVKHDIRELDLRAEEHLLNSVEIERSERQLGFEFLLHPVIERSSYQLFRDGHLREAVLNSVTAIFDLIRDRTRLPEDGDRLIGQAMSITNPRLILSDLETESGLNDQKGFMQIYKGSFQGIRNPKAHSLTHDLTEPKAAQYLVFASLLARRIEEAHLVDSASNSHD